jgi:hypothetical protein
MTADKYMNVFNIISHQKKNYDTTTYPLKYLKFIVIYYLTSNQDIHSTLRCLPNKNENTPPHQNLYANVPGNICHAYDSYKLEQYLNVRQTCEQINCIMPIQRNPNQK